MTEERRFETWAIVELFGHQRVAGLVSEQSVGGCSFIRVDVPEANGLPAMTKFYGQGAIYCMTPTTEELARRAANSFRPAPVARYELPAPPARPEPEDGLFDDGESQEEKHPF